MLSNRILVFLKALLPPSGLPTAVHTMNPFQDDAAWRVVETFYQQYYHDQQPRTVLLGINPGRFGGGITGIPFTDPIRLEDPCGIPNSFEKRAELSSIFVYDVIAACGGPKAFYSRFYISALSPLGYTMDGKNLNYYDISGWKGIFEAYAKTKIEEQLAFPLNREIAYCIGQGENLKFLTYLNNKYGFFKAIETLPHPRWVMQYRLKQKDKFVQEYLRVLDGV